MAGKLEERWAGDEEPVGVEDAKSQEQKTPWKNLVPFNKNSDDIVASKAERNSVIAYIDTQMIEGKKPFPYVMAYMSHIATGAAPSFVFDPAFDLLKYLK